MILVLKMEPKALPSSPIRDLAMELRWSGLVGGAFTAELPGGAPQAKF